MFRKTMAFALIALSVCQISISSVHADDRDDRWGGDRRDNPNWGDRRRIDRQYIRQLASDLETQSAELQRAVAFLPGFVNLDRDAQRLSQSARSFRDVVNDRSRPRELLISFSYVENDFQNLYSNFLRAMGRRTDEPSYYQTLRTFADVGEIYAILKNELSLSDDDQPLPPPPPPPRPPPGPFPPPNQNEPVYVSQVTGEVNCNQNYDLVDLTVRRSGYYRVDWSYSAPEAYNFAIPTYSIIDKQAPNPPILNQAAGADARHGMNASGAPLVMLREGRVYTMKQSFKMRFCAGDSFNRRVSVSSTIRVIFDRDGR